MPLSKIAPSMVMHWSGRGVRYLKNFPPHGTDLLEEQFYHCSKSDKNHVKGQFSYYQVQTAGKGRQKIVKMSLCFPLVDKV